MEILFFEASLAFSHSATGVTNDTTLAATLKNEGEEEGLFQGLIQDYLGLYVVFKTKGDPFLIQLKTHHTRKLCILGYSGGVVAQFQQRLVV